VDVNLLCFSTLDDSRSCFLLWRISQKKKCCFNNKFLIEKAREEAIKVVSNDPDLKENIILRNLLIDNSDNKFIHDFLN